MPPELENPFDEDDALHETWEIIRRWLESEAQIFGVFDEAVADEVFQAEIRADDINIIMRHTLEQFEDFGREDIEPFARWLFEGKFQPGPGTVVIALDGIRLTKDARDDFLGGLDPLVERITARSDTDLAWKLFLEQVDAPRAVVEDLSRSLAEDYWLDVVNATGEDFAFVDVLFRDLLPVVERTGSIPTRETISASQKLLVGLVGAGVDFNTLTPQQEQALSRFQTEFNKQLPRARATALAAGEVFDENQFIAGFAGQAVALVLEPPPIPPTFEEMQTMANKIGLEQFDTLMGNLKEDPATDEEFVLRQAFQDALRRAEEMRTLERTFDFSSLFQQALDSLPTPQEVKRRRDIRFGPTPPGTRFVTQPVPGAPSGVPISADVETRRRLDELKQIFAIEDESVKQPLLSEFIRKEGLNVEIPATGEPINEADVVLASIEPFSAQAIITEREAQVGVSAQEVEDRLQEANSRAEARAAELGVEVAEAEDDPIIAAALAEIDRARQQQNRREQEERARPEQEPIIVTEPFVPPEPGEDLRPNTTFTAEPEEGFVRGEEPPQGPTSEEEDVRRRRAASVPRRLSARVR